MEDYNVKNIVLDIFFSRYKNVLNKNDLKELLE